MIMRMIESAIPRLAYAIVGVVPMKGNDTCPRRLLTNPRLCNRLPLVSAPSARPHWAPLVKLKTRKRPSRTRFSESVAIGAHPYRQVATTPWLGAVLNMPAKPAFQSGQRIHCSLDCFQHPRPPLIEDRAD